LKFDVKPEKFDCEKTELTGVATGFADPV